MKRSAISLVAVACAGFAVLLPNVAKADSVIAFNVSGTATALAGQSCASNCPFSGTLTVDVTTGVATAADITFPGLDVFNTVANQQALGSLFDVVFVNGPQDLALVFTTTTPGSLVGFEGGTIDNQGAVVTLATNDAIYTINSGTITAPSAATPEPSSLILMGTGLLGFAGVLRKRVRL